MYPFLDIHTHAWPDTGQTGQKVFRAFHQEEKDALAGYEADCSAGLHPWFLSSENFAAQWEWFEQAVHRPNVKIVGEIGLDRLRGPGLDFQQDVFEKQLKVASALGKPVVIHCVRAFEELRICIQKTSPKTILILHGFNRSEKIMEKLLPLGMGFSFGADLCKSGNVSQRVIGSVPPERLFLETDASRMSIRTIYEKAAEVLALPVERLQERIWENGQKIGIV